MIKLSSLLQENSTSSYSYGCAMLHFDFPQLSKIQSIIDPKHIYFETGDKTYGLEDQPHCTLLYGLHHDISVEKIKRALSKFVFSTCTIHNPSIFENDKYDVLKFDVTGKSLHEANAELRKFPHTNDYPKYCPHLTIGYLVSGRGQRYAQKLNDVNLDFKLQPSHIIYSEASGTQTKIPIKIA